MESSKPSVPEVVEGSRHLAAVHLGYDIGFLNDASVLVIDALYEQVRISKESLSMEAHRIQARSLHDAYMAALRRGRETVHTIQRVAIIPSGTDTEGQIAVLLSALDDVAIAIASEAQANADGLGEKALVNNQFAEGYTSRRVPRVVLIDRNGVGLPVTQEFQKALRRDAAYSDVQLRPIVTTSGDTYNPGRGSMGNGYGPSRLAALMSSGLIVFNAADPGVRILRGQMSIFERRMTPSGHATYGNAGGAGKHDDCISALALAVLTEPRDYTASIGMQLFPGSR